MELVGFLFTVPGVGQVLSNKLCQDPIEKFFGMQRQRGRASENPNAQEFLKNTQALRVIHGVCRNIKGNCRGSTSDNPLAVTAEPLPKRRRT